MFWSNVFRYFFNIIQTLSFFHVPFWSDCEMFIVSCSTLRENHEVAPKTVWLPANMPRNIRSDSKKSLNVEQRRCSETNKSQERGISGKTRQTSLWTKRLFVFYCYPHSLNWTTLWLRLHRRHQPWKLWLRIKWRWKSWVFFEWMRQQVISNLLSRMTYHAF